MTRLEIDPAVLQQAAKGIEDTIGQLSEMGIGETGNMGRGFALLTLSTLEATAGLPPVFSPNRGFGYFGVPPDTADTVVYVGGTEADLRRWFTSV
ncbi:hypothetical protein ACFWFJ_25315, partial [Nocardia salmonicida]